MNIIGRWDILHFLKLIIIVCDQIKSRCYTVEILKMKQTLFLITISLHASIIFSQLDSRSSSLLMVRPNPTTGDSELLTDSTFLNKQVVVLNQTGQQVDALIIRSLRQRIPSGFYQRGIYYIRLENNETLRLIKE